MIAHGKIREAKTAVAEAINSKAAAICCSGEGRTTRREAIYALWLHLAHKIKHSPESDLEKIIRHHLES